MRVAAGPSTSSSLEPRQISARAPIDGDDLQARLFYELARVAEREPAQGVASWMPSGLRGQLPLISAA